MKATRAHAELVITGVRNAEMNQLLMFVFWVPCLTPDSQIAGTLPLVLAKPTTASQSSSSALL